MPHSFSSVLFYSQPATAISLFGRLFIVRPLAVWVVKHVDVVEHVLPCFVSCDVCSPSDPFVLEQVQEALCDRLVMAIPTPAHACIQIVFAKK